MFNSPYTSAAAGGGGAGFWNCAGCSSKNMSTAKNCAACGRQGPDQNNTMSSSQTPSRTGSQTPQQYHGMNIPSATPARGSSTTPKPASSNYNDPNSYNNNNIPNAAATPNNNNQTQNVQSGGSTTTPGYSQYQQQQQQQQQSQNVLGNLPSNTPNNSNNVNANASNMNTPFNPLSAGSQQQEIGGATDLRSNSNYNNQQQTPQPTTPQPQSQQQQSRNSVLPETLTTGARDAISEQQQQRASSTTPSGVGSSSALRNNPNTNNPNTNTNRNTRSPTPMQQGGSGMHPLERKHYEKEVDFLRSAVTESKKFGIEIENTVEYLTDLLRRKTLECSSLRTLATENYEPVRRAIQDQFKSQHKREKTFQQELKFYQARIETLYGERTTLVSSNNALKERCGELERQLRLAQIPASTATEPSFFNKLLYDEKDSPPYHEYKLSVANPLNPLITQVTNTTPKQAQMLKQLGLLKFLRRVCDADITLRLHHFGFFKYMDFLLTSLLVEQHVSPETFATAISESYKNYTTALNEPPPEKVSAAKNQHFREKTSSLYQYFFPGQEPELRAILDIHDGKEYDLWQDHLQKIAEVFEEREKERKDRKKAAAQAVKNAAVAAAQTGDLSSGLSPGAGGPDNLNNAKASSSANKTEIKISDEDLKDDEEAAAEMAAEATNSNLGAIRSFTQDDFDEEDENAYGDNNEDNIEDNDHDPYYSASAASGGSSPRRSSSRRRGSPRAGGGGEGNYLDSKELDLHTRITLLCYKYNPQKLHSKELPKLMAKYQPEVLLAAFKEKYGKDGEDPEPVGEERRTLLLEIAKL